MLDIKFIRENKELVAKAAKDKGVKVDIDEVLEVDKDVGVLNTVKQ
ncbi:MAG: Serine-tRNA ligase, partial [Candidatus Levybacteria bacterium GW2011_GWA2_36_13]